MTNKEGGAIAAHLTAGFMEAAFVEARAAAVRGETPVGAVVVRSGHVISAAGNEVEARGDPTAHAEILALRRAGCRLSNFRLSDCDLYVTLEPCPLCAAAISLFRLRRLYFGAYDPQGGGVDHGPRLFAQPSCRHAPEVIGGVREVEAAQLLRDFFQKLRANDATR